MSHPSTLCVEWEPTAWSKVQDLPERTALTIMEDVQFAVTTICNGNVTDKVKLLTGNKRSEKRWRIESGKYRIIATRAAGALIILDVIYRDETCYRKINKQWRQEKRTPKLPHSP